MVFQDFVRLHVPDYLKQNTNLGQGFQNFTKFEQVPCYLFKPVFICIDDLIIFTLYFT